MILQRSLFQKLSDELIRPEISILLGARQVGKSTLMRQLESQIKRRGLKTRFYDLEQSADLKKLAGIPQKVFRELTENQEVVFIDEFPYLKNASKIFKAIYDSRKKLKIYASGSSSLQIHKHLKESLAGRFMKSLLYPLDLEELSQRKSFRPGEFLQWGGLPGLFGRATPLRKLDLLENIVSTYITKDIKALIKEENVRAFNSLLYLLAQSQGSVVTASSLARETGLHEMAVHRYLDLMAQTYVLHPLPSYSGNLANELKKSKKYYLYDLGILNALLRDVRPVQKRKDKGCLYESAVLLNLIPQLKANMEIRFWRTKKGQEVDFVIVKNRVPFPIEVKSGLKEVQVSPGLRMFLERYPESPFAIVFNEKISKKIRLKNKTIHFRIWSESSHLSYLDELF